MSRVDCNGHSRNLYNNWWGGGFGEEITNIWGCQSIKGISFRKTLCHEITDVELGTNQSVIKSSGGFVSGETHFGVIDSKARQQEQQPAGDQEKICSSSKEGFWAFRGTESRKIHKVHHISPYHTGCECCPAIRLKCTTNAVVIICINAPYRSSHKEFI